MKPSHACWLSSLVLCSFLCGCNRSESANSGRELSPTASLEEIRGEETAAVTAAPNVPPPLRRRYAAKVRIDIEVREHVKTLADGVTYTYWTFGDDAPGNFIRVREGDLVETHFSNHPDNALAHNIDFHAATGPGGGGEASFVAPGHRATFTWRAMRAGLYLYHCVAAPAGMHLASGMYGLILVEPREGLPPVDREYFIVQGEFYTSGTYGEPGQQTFALDKALREQPEYVVFNGRVGALTGENALRVRSGESVRLYLGNAGPSLVSSFHIVGEIFDHVYGEGGTRINQTNVQTTIVPVGGTAMVELVADVPGGYQFVDHSMFRAFNKGAMGTLEVEGRARPELFSGRQLEAPYDPGTHLQRVADAIPAATPSPLRSPANVAVSGPLEAGRALYASICTACHQPDGRGLPGLFPPLAQSDFLMGDEKRAVRVLLEGLQGPITVNGQSFNGVMPNFSLRDEQIAAVLSYVRNNFGNRGRALRADDVQRVRAALREKRPERGDRLASQRPG